ncbi:hypothetical protein F8154_05720 [Alkaliphilus pronyensis]|uniref:Ig-like domain-containing protein n=1 Tax=Alkaliphilus pronyensis TaxID=1482732 RepID=A0A6I0F045_9FIRM|nr:hypothetical protein [Alkaliphilus pronyensis]KAB3535628.1 hypothetical protein F8154_05720 [Alkaliphilus pronyensis]
MKFKRTLSCVLIAITLITSISIYSFSNSYPIEDYRDVVVWDSNNERVDKPHAEFEVQHIDGADNKNVGNITSDSGVIKRVVVGDKIKVSDDNSTRGSGGKFKSWDFQVHSQSTKIEGHKNTSPVGKEITINTDGYWDFYLAVRDDKNVKLPTGGTYHNWSDNGSHSMLDDKRVDIDGVIWKWYFSWIRVVAEYARAEIRHIDLDTGENIIPVENISNLTAGNYSYSKKDFQEYEFVKSAVGYTWDELVSSAGRNEKIESRNVKLSGDNKMAFLTFYYKKEAPPRTDTYVDVNGITNPASVQFTGSDIPTKVNVEGTLHNFDNKEDINYWILFVKPEGASKWNTQVVNEKEMSVERVFNELINKSVMDGKEEYIQNYEMKARVYIDSYYIESDVKKVSTHVYKTKPSPPQEPPAPPQDPKEPPVAIINGPTEVMVGDDVIFSGYRSYTQEPGATMIHYLWYSDPNDINVDGVDKPSLNTRFNEIKEYELCLQVVDSFDGGDYTTHMVNVIPPVPKARIKIDGNRANNAIIVDGRTSRGNDLYPIDWSKAQWEVTAIEGGTLENVYFEVPEGNITYQNKKVIITGLDKFRLQSNSENNLEFKLYVENTYGNSDEATVSRKIEPDLAPIVDFTTVTTIFRDPDNNNKATIKATDLSHSLDGDIIKDRIWKVYYNNNNGNIVNYNNNSEGISYNANWSLLQTIKKGQSDFTLDLDVSEIGKYRLELEVAEDFKNPSLPNGSYRKVINNSLHNIYVDFSVYKQTSDSSTIDINKKVIEVKNIAPVVNLQMLKKPKVDISLAYDEMGISEDQLLSKLNSILIPKLEANNIQYEINIDLALGKLNKRDLQLEKKQIPIDFKKAGHHTSGLKETADFVAVNHEKEELVIAYRLIDEVNLKWTDTLRVVILDIETNTIKDTYDLDVYISHKSNTFLKKASAILDNKLYFCYSEYCFFDTGEDLTFAALDLEEKKVVNKKRIDNNGSNSSVSLENHNNYFYIRRGTSVYKIDKDGNLVYKYKMQYESDERYDFDYKRDKAYKIKPKTSHSSYMIIIDMAADKEINTIIFNHYNWENVTTADAVVAATDYGLFVYNTTQPVELVRFNYVNYEYERISVSGLIGYPYHSDFTRQFEFGDRYARVYYYGSGIASDEPVLREEYILDMKDISYVSGKDYTYTNNSKSPMSNYVVDEDLVYSFAINWDRNSLYARVWEGDTVIDGLYLDRHSRGQKLLNKKFGIGMYTKEDVNAYIVYFRDLVRDLAYKPKKEWDKEKHNFSIFFSNKPEIEIVDPVQTITTLAENNVNFIGVGNNDNKGQIENIAVNNFDNGLFLSIDDIDNSINELSDYIIQKAKEDILLDYYVLIDEEIEFKTFYEDKENDPIMDERWLFQHDPNYFENSMGLDERSGVYINEPIRKFEKAGHFKTLPQLRDNPKDDNRFDAYRLWSLDTTEINLYAHRRAISDFNYTLQYNPTQNNFTISIRNTAYDLDHISKYDRGIVDVIYKYKEINSNRWIDGKPSILDINKEYLILQTVEDREGVWSFPKIEHINTSIENIPPIITVTPEKTEGWYNKEKAITDGELTLQVTANAFMGKTISQVRHSWSNSITTPAAWTTTTQSNFNVTQTSDGIWYLHIEATDSGGQNTAAVFGPYKIDRTPPTPPTINNNQAWTNVSQVPVTIKNGTDNLSGVDRVEYRLTGATTLNWTTYTGQFNIVNAGITNIYARTIDVAGNTSTDTNSKVRIDRTPPTIDTDLKSYEGMEAIDVTITASDTGGSALKDMRYKWTTSTTKPTTGWTTTTQSNVTTPRDTEGEWYLHMESFDNAGNSYYRYRGPYIINFLSVSATLLPNPAMAGDQLIFDITTEGYADTLEIFVDPDIIAMDKRVDMGYEAQEYPVTAQINKHVNIKTDTIKFILWVTTEETLDKNNNRLREPYKFTVRAWKGTSYKEVELELEVQGNILRLLKPGIKNKHDR